MQNYAGCADKDKELEDELTLAGIEINRYPESMRGHNTEVKTVIYGHLHGWNFTRAWYYWMASGPGIPPVYANPLHEKYGKEVRVAGHCGCPSPKEWYNGFAVGSYHIDSLIGLKALADTIKQVVIDSEKI